GWSRFDSYGLEGDGWVYPGSGLREQYDPAADLSLPSELARVNRVGRRGGASGREQRRVAALLGFYERFGFLGHTALRGAPRRLPAPRLGLADGDQLAWALAHAENVDLCLRLAYSLRGSRTEGLRQVFAYLDQTRPKLFPGLPLTIPTLTGSPQPSS